jgi:hydroxyacyl-ACP dehydratase HTD2-like protein with hotdog domain
MTTAAPALTLADVAVGDALPKLHHDVTATTVVAGALATRDWRPQHHDYHFATERNGLRDIVLSAPNQAAWFERYLTDWSGPAGRLGRMSFRMSDSVFPGETMTLTGVVTSVTTDDHGCGWAEVDVTLAVGERRATSCQARVALPLTADDNPWARRGERWAP